MKTNKSKISFFVSLGIHIVLILAISPLLIKNLYETEDNLSLFFLKRNPKNL